MTRKARFAGYDFSIEKNREGIHVSVRPTEGHAEAQAEVFQMFDQFRKTARQNGVGTGEILTYWVKKQLGMK
ncbi:MAG: hypothetical protein M1294_10935 [Firmicutes bacterium]|jgi:hypothetical protein|uniref:Uncharacterized protein n=1 Tax=Sulfobacillus benefaciens TaxID=453960 RepID=A0A2T2X6M0_9FIRM|nr:hypothetical protein [Bacillota bacterium]MCL5015719.1 hypothetical protein [Bacillota bacterium]PSR30142.1 MAG: hypothetical protein C7B43_07635 [Sulfobacillus benefaciens]HBQ95343.1 hypothetical protein [Sulfobacillus sp.]